MNIQTHIPTNRKTRIDLDEALQRVKFVHGRYSYEPSSAYKRMLSKFAKKHALIPIVNEI